MSNCTSVPSGYKFCQKGDDCAHPEGPILPIEQFYGSKIHADGLFPWCKDCKREYDRGLRAEKQEHYKEYRRKYREEHYEQERNAQKKYYRKNAPKILEQKSRDRKANPTLYRQRDREYYWRNREKFSLKFKTYYTKNREQMLARSAKYRQQHRERYQQLSIQWQKRNKHKKALNERRRRASKQSAVGDHSMLDIEKQIQSQSDHNGILRCWWCEKPIEGEYHVDHRVPLAKGGSDNASNLVIAHPKCNMSKGPKMPWEYNGRLL